MANTASFLPLLLLLFVSSVVARPCKTLVISTYTVAEVHPDVFAVVAEVHEFHPRPLNFPGNPRFRPLHHPRAFFTADVNRQTLIRQPEINPGPGSSSLRDRTVDILSVIASLLFGAVCGALTAATMYLVWSIFNCRFVAYRSLNDFSDDDDDDIFNPKKVHGNEISKPSSTPSPADSVETALLKKESV